MGAACCKTKSTQERQMSASGNGTLKAMFDRVDKEKKGYISIKNLQDLMRDDKTYFQGKDANHIMSKFGSDDKMTFDQFKGWWSSTYTTYNDDINLSRLVDELHDDGTPKQLSMIMEVPGAEDPSSHSFVQTSHSSNLAVSRS